MLFFYLVDNISAHFIYLYRVGLANTILSLSALKGLLYGIYKDCKAQGVRLLIQVINNTHTTQKEYHCYVLEGFLVLIIKTHISGLQKKTLHYLLISSKDCVEIKSLKYDNLLFCKLY